MKVSCLRLVAVALSLGTCTLAQAQGTYRSPSRWDNYYPVSHIGQEEAGVQETAAPAQLDAPAQVDQLPALAPQPMPLSDAVGDGCPQCQGSPYQQAMSAPCGVAAAPELFPWFGGANVLFMTLEEGRGSYMASGLGSDFYTSLVDPQSATGFDASFGRYLGGGRFGFGVTYFHFNPSEESIARFAPAGTIASANSAYRDISINAGGAGVDTVYNYIDGSGPVAGATGMFIKRDVGFQGIEANLFSFGLMGARRTGYGYGAVPCLGLGNRLGDGRYGFGGATGPLVRARTGRVQVVTSHGFRWFQATDFVESGYDIDGTLGFQSEDLYEKVDIQNNLYGYQFGGRLTYCLHRRLNLHVGGKFGLYGNRAERRHCVGTRTTLAYRNGVATDTICSKSVDNSLATLGELDLGLGFRLSNAWTIEGGYRLMGITGVANAIDSHPTSYSSTADSGQVRADDNYVLQGGYVGLAFNW